VPTTRLPHRHFPSRSAPVPPSAGNLGRTVTRRAWATGTRSDAAGVGMDVGSSPLSANGPVRVVRAVVGVQTACGSTGPRRRATRHAACRIASSSWSWRRTPPQT
jgi:hypothetical protein